VAEERRAGSAEDMAQKTQQPLRQSGQSLKVLDAPPACGGGKEDAPRASAAFPPKAALSKCGLGNIRIRFTWMPTWA